jgi:hypothetical protein
MVSWADYSFGVRGEFGKHVSALQHTINLSYSSGYGFDLNLRLWLECG